MENTENEVKTEIEAEVVDENGVNNYETDDVSTISESEAKKDVTSVSKNEAEKEEENDVVESSDNEQL